MFSCFSCCEKSPSHRPSKSNIENPIGKKDISVKTNYSKNSIQNNIVVKKSIQQQNSCKSSIKAKNSFNHNEDFEKTQLLNNIKNDHNSSFVAENNNVQEATIDKIANKKDDVEIIVEKNKKSFENDYQQKDFFNPKQDSLQNNFKESDIQSQSKNTDEEETLLVKKQEQFPRNQINNQTFGEKNKEPKVVEIQREELEEIKNENLILQRKNEKLNKKVEKLKDSLEKKSDEFNSLSKTHEKTTKNLSDCQKKLMSFSEKDANLSEDRSTSKKKNKTENLHENRKKTKKQSLKADQIKEPMEELKEFQINIDSLMVNKNGWKILKNTLTINKEEEYLIFGLLGSKIAGKSFVLSKLMKTEENNEYIPNKGINFIEFNKYKTIAIDSEGLNAATEYNSEILKKRFSTNNENLIYEKEEIKTQLINDRILTDVFLSEFITEASQIIIIVVDVLCLSDQKLIERICKKKSNKKRVIIIHNFKHIKSLSQIKNYINKDIINSFQVTKSLIPSTEVTYYIEKNDNKSENISHYIMAQEKSEAGEIYNNACIDHIRKMIEANIERRNFDIYKDLTKFLKENSRSYFQFKNKLENNRIKLKKNIEKFSLEFEGICQISNPIYNDYLPKTMDDPRYQIIENDKKYQCLIEICDLDKKTLALSIDKNINSFNMLIVKGVKKEISQEEGGLVFGNRKTGEFLYQIPLGKRFIFLENEITHEYKKGTLIVIIWKKQDLEEQIN